MVPPQKSLDLVTAQALFVPKEQCATMHTSIVSTVKALDKDMKRQGKVLKRVDTNTRGIMNELAALKVSFTDIHTDVEALKQANYDDFLGRLGKDAKRIAWKVTKYGVIPTGGLGALYAFLRESGLWDIILRMIGI